MPLRLDTRCIEQFSTELARALVNARVMYGRYIDPSWLRLGERVARILPQTDKSRQAAGLASLSNLGLSFFLMDQLGDMLKAADRKNESEISALSEQPGFEDLDAVAARLTAAMLTLPWDYELMLLTPLAGSDAPLIPLNDTFTLRVVSDPESAAFPVHPVDELARHMFHRSFPETAVSDRYYFVGQFRGYLLDFSPIAEVEIFVDAAKGLLGLAVAAPILKLERAPYGSPPLALPILVYRIIDGRRQPLEYQWLSPENTEILSRLQSPRLEDPTIGTRVLAAIQASFTHAATRGAARWYLDSFSGSNGVLQTVQATVALEMLLGDRKHSKEVGVTKLLANRLAFLIGTSPQQRDRVMSEFEELYDVRSDIVHNGKAVLDAKESNALHLLRDYARRAIVKQMEQIWTEAGRNASPRPAAG